MNIPANVTSDAALARQNVAFASIKQAAQQEQQLAKIVEEAAEQGNQLLSAGSRGTNFNSVV